MEKYGIIGAMESEVCKLCDDLAGKEIVEYAGLRFFTGILEGKATMGHRTKRIGERGDEKHRKPFIYNELRWLRL